MLRRPFFNFALSLCIVIFPPEADPPSAEIFQLYTIYAFATASAKIRRAPAPFKTRAASERVAPEVTTSSTRIMFLPATGPASATEKHPSTFFLRASIPFISLCGLAWRERASAPEATGRENRSAMCFAMRND